MSSQVPRVLFLGGNGHCAARLEPARAVLKDRADATGVPAFELIDAAYPGFEGRPRAAGFEQFLDTLDDVLRHGAEGGSGPTLLYGTGIGGLLALCLRAQGRGPGTRLLLQAPVLWGLERRLMPALMRLGPVRARASRFFGSWLFHAWLRRRHLPSALDPSLARDIRRGYAQCAALSDLFHWLTPSLLRELEEHLAARRQVLEGVAVWWGGRDRVVTPRELELTENALGVRWPLRLFEAWGHYPMLEDPRGWVEALAAVVSPR